MNLFQYRDKLTSAKMNETLVPLDSTVERLLSVADTVGNHTKNIQFVQTHIQNYMYHLGEVIESDGISIAEGNKCLLPMYLPTKSYQIELLGGTFSLQRDWKSSIDLISHGPFTLSSFDVSIDGIELNSIERELFGALFSGESTWFVKEVTTDNPTIEISATTQYPATEIMITGLPHQTYNIELLSPEPVATYGNLFLIDSFNSGTVKFTMPSIIHNGKKYVCLKYVGLRYSLPAAYGEIVIDFNYTPGEILTRLYKIADGSDNQIRIVISNKDDYIVLRDTEEELDVEETVIYDSMVDPIPLSGGYYDLSDTLYLHLILLNSTDVTPHVKRIQWALT